MNYESILFICSVSNFQQYTRRATIEAIGNLNKKSAVICLRSFWKKYEKVKQSNEIDIFYFYYFFPRMIVVKSKILNYFNFYLNLIFVNSNLRKFKNVCFTFPTQSHLLPFFKESKKVFILSDPYHLMKQNKSEESLLINGADLIFATAKSLKTQYVSKYFGNITAKIIYWPNCVDLNIWNVNLFPIAKRPNINDQIKIGFAGNFMKVTDILLLDGIVKSFPKERFILAGKIENDLSHTDQELLESIFSQPNVEYKGLIPFNNLPSEISSWDIGLMIDKINEIASYHHHNKFYQYLSLGKPVVYQLNHTDYEDASHIAFGADDLTSYCSQIEIVISKIRSGHNFLNDTLPYVKSHSNFKRAERFLHLLR